MANKKCDGCNSEIDTIETWRNMADLEFCTDCFSKILTLIEKFENFDSRISGSIFYTNNPRRINQLYYSIFRLIDTDDVIVDYIFGLAEKSLYLGSQSGLMILTEKRLITFINANVGRNFCYEYITNIENVIDISFETGFVSNNIKIRDKGGEVKTGKLQTSDTDRTVSFKQSFSDLQSKLSKHNNQQPTQIIQQSDNIDKLKKLKELLDLGIISQEEFNEKKKVLLDNL